jgi:hypothetical protein
MQSGKRLTLKDYFAKHTRTHKNHKNTNVELFILSVLANQNAKLTGPDQGFLVSPLVLIGKPWERGCRHISPKEIYGGGGVYRRLTSRVNNITLVKNCQSKNIKKSET